MSCVPELRFKDFNEEWDEKMLNKFVEINPTNSSLPETFYYIDLRSVEKGILKKKKKILKTNAPSRAQRILKENDILFQMVRPYQKNNLFFKETDENYVASTGYAQIRTKSPDFIFQLLHTDNFVNKSLKLCTGTTYPAINTSNLKKIKVNIPSIKEQEKIANFISIIDEKIVILEDKLQLYETYKKGIMTKLFSHELRFRDDEGNSYPDWEEKKLGNLSNIKTGNKYLKDAEISGKYPFFVRSAKIEKINSYSFDGEAILIPCDGKIGEIFHYMNGKFDYHQQVYKISDFVNVLGKFVYYFLQENFLKYALRNTSKTTVDSLRLPIIKEMIINVPLIKEQEKIANFISIIDEKLIESKNEILFNKKFKKGLLQKMFC